MSAASALIGAGSLQRSSPSAIIAFVVLTFGWTWGLWESALRSRPTISVKAA